MHGVLVIHLVKFAQEKMWLGELTVSICNDHTVDRDVNQKPNHLVQALYTCTIKLSMENVF